MGSLELEPSSTTKFEEWEDGDTLRLSSFASCPLDFRSQLRSSPARLTVCQVTEPLFLSRSATNIQMAALLNLSWSLLLTRIYGLNNLPVDIEVEYMSGAAELVARSLHTNFALDIESVIDQNITRIIQLFSNLSIASETTNRDITTFGHSQTRISLVFHCGSSSDTDMVIMDCKSKATEVMSILCSVVAPGHISCHSLHDGSIWTAETASRALRQFIHISQQICGFNENARIDSISLLGDHDIRTLQEWNSIPAEAVQATIHQLFSTQASMNSTATAVESSEDQLSYGHLEDLSSTLASFLIRKGVTKGTMVPMLFEKSVWAVVVMLAVLKSGGVCVGMCATHPIQTIQKTLEQTAAEFVLVSESQALRLEGIDNEIISSTRMDIWNMTTSTPIKLPIKPSDIAYIVFTSGSTGTPKGIVLDHVTLATSMKSHGRSLNVSADSRVLQFSSYAFDMSVYEIFTTLSAGGCVCIPSETERLNSLTNFIRDHNINWAFFTPSLLRNFQPHEIPSIRTICVGGERVGTDLVAQWSKHVQLLTLWGPAEVTICASGAAQSDTWIPGTFGKAVGCTAWLTEQNNPDKLVAIGGIGEVLIEGPVVALGYLKDLEKTKASFIPSPKWRKSFSTRVQYPTFFRTGDLAQYNTDGSMRFISRMGTMVKINGQRVDIDAVESALRDIETDLYLTVQAITLEDSSGGCILIAFLSSCKGGPGESKQGQELRFNSPSEDWEDKVHGFQQSLLERLPRYMVPRLFIIISNIPLNRNGKIDKPKLQSLVSGHSLKELLSICGMTFQQSELDSLTTSEMMLRTAVAEVLGMNPHLVKMHLNFLQLGGDSLLAVRLAGICRQRQMLLKVEVIILQSLSLREVALRMVPIVDREEHRTLEFASLTNPKGKAELFDVVLDQSGLPASSIEDIYPCTPLQEGLMTMTSKSNGAQAYVDRLLFRLPRTVNLTELQTAWSKVVVANDILRSRIILSKDSRMFNVTIREEQLAWLSYQSMDQYLSEDTKLETGLGKQLFRLSLIDSGLVCDRICLAVTIHHALYDGWSLALLLEQVEAAYQQKEITTYHFSAFVHHLQTQQDFKASREFWSTHLSSLSAATFPEVPAADYIPSATTSAKIFDKAQYRRNCFSMANKIQLAWVILLSLYTGSDDVVYGLVMNGRITSMSAIENVTGPTITTIPFRSLVNSHETIENAMRAIQDQIALIIPHEQIGLQHITRMGGDAAVACKFQNLLVIQQSFSVNEHSIFFDRTDLVGGLNSFPGYGLILLCNPRADGWEFEILFDQNLLQTEQVNKMLQQLVHLLHQIDDNSHKMLNSIDFLSPEDKSQISLWNSHKDFRYQSSIHELIQQQFATQVTKTAIAAWDGNFSYLELDRLSSVAAISLQALGVGRETITPILFEKSKWLIVAILAVLKAGGAFTLLDTSQTAQRHEDICRIVDAAVIITSESCAQRMLNLADTVYVVDERDESFSNKQPDRFSAVRSDPKDLLYVVFTSGSTGQPKGVMIDNGSYCSAIVAQKEKLHLNSSSRVLQLSSYAFDSFAVEILTSLVSGACVCMPSEAESRNDIAAVIRDFEVNWMCITPSMLRLLKPEDVPSLKTIVAVGESMVHDQIALWSVNVDLICGYGPSECSTGASAQLITSPEADPRNIGSGMGACLWVVHIDNHETLVPVGTIGELIIQGPIVGRGYLRDLEKTQAAFLENTSWLSSFPSVCKERFYKTWDLVRYNEDGTCTYVGRKNQYVKLRGQRLDITDIERHLRDTFGLEIVADIITPLRSNSVPLLTAFLEDPQHLEKIPSENAVTFLKPSPKTNKQTIVADAKLRSSLPALMIPSLYLRLQKMPLTTSGKINRRLLHAAASSYTASDLFSLGSNAGLDTIDPLDSNETTALFLSKALSDIMTSRVESAESRILGQNLLLSRTVLDSIDAIALSRVVSQKYDVKLSIKMLFDSSKSVRDIARFIDANGLEEQVATPFDLYSEFEILRDELQEIASLARAKNESVEPYEYHAPRVFLTGGTGFLGVHILGQLVQDPLVVSVTVLVHSFTQEQALSRLIKAAKVAGWWSECYLDKVEVWTGDLGQPRLGLDDDHWNMLCGRSAIKFNSIIHNGAMVHWSYDHHTLKPVNVMSTFHLLSALSHTNHDVRLTYVSALVPSADQNDDSQNARTISSDGYSQTKYVSELLIRHYKEHMSLHPYHRNRVAIIRPGLIIGSAGNGIANADDYLWRTVAGALSIGAYSSEDSDSWIFLSAVDWVANLIVSESLTTSSETMLATPVQIISVWDGVKVSDLWRAVQLVTSTRLTRLTSVEWLKLMQKQLDKVGKSHPFWPVFSIFESTNGVLGLARPSTNQAPTLTSMLVRAIVKNVQYLRSVGALNTPVEQNDSMVSSTQDVFRRVRRFA